MNWITAADKVLHDRAFNIAKDPKFDGYQCGVASTVYTFFYKKNFRVVVIKMKIYLIKN